MLPLLFDEGLPGLPVARAFRELGLEAHSIGEEGAPPRKSSDKENCQWCAEHRAVLVTNDRGKRDRTILDHLAQEHVHAIFVHDDLKSAPEHIFAGALLKAESKLEHYASGKGLVRRRLRINGGLEKV
jgi:uncharacterized protein with PIN domain